MMCKPSRCGIASDGAAADHMHRFLKQSAVEESSTLVSSTHDPKQISDGCHGSVDDMGFNQHWRPHSTFWVSAVVVSGTFFISHLAAQVTSSNATGQSPPSRRTARLCAASACEVCRCRTRQS